MKTLSILICHLESRKEMLDRLMACLDRQKNADVEILIETDNGKDNGGLARGAKRNKLLYNARGRYICYVDDDDLVSDGSEHPAYIPSIFEALERGPVFDCNLANEMDEVASYTPHQGERPVIDCVGIQGEIRFANDPHLLFYHSMKHSIEWWDDAATAEPGKAQYYRTPNHLNPVRRELALQARFINSQDWSEDHSYGRLLHRIIKNEAPINHPIYYYIK